MILKFIPNRISKYKSLNGRCAMVKNLTSQKCRQPADFLFIDNTDSTLQGFLPHEPAMNNLVNRVNKRKASSCSPAPSQERNANYDSIRLIHILSFNFSILLAATPQPEKEKKNKKYWFCSLMNGIR